MQRREDDGVELLRTLRIANRRRRHIRLDFRYAGYDESHGERYEDSGGAILYAAPSLRVKLPWGLEEQPASLRFAVQLPLAETWLHNEQYEKAVWSVGVLVPF